MIVFQLTASRRGWRTIWCITAPLTPHFNSQPHEEADFAEERNLHFHFLFQLTASRRGWHGGLKYCIEHKNFNSQPHEEADKTKGLSVSEHGYFNSQPHEEADDSNFTVYNGVNISTHSLTKRLTLFPTLWGFHLSYFNSQPHEEADVSWSCFQKFLVHFNSQPHEEADLPQFEMFKCVDISTHSLTKRLTFLCTGNVTSVDISTHSLTKRLTLNQDWFLQEFNISTHSLTKRLTSVSSFALTFTYISTHSLTKRLTSTLHKNSAHEIFQLTASRRGWQ